MNPELVNTIIFAVSFATLVVISYHFIMKHIRERQMMNALAACLIQERPEINPVDPVSKVGPNKRRRYTVEEDAMILDAKFRDSVIAGKLNRSVPAIQVRRHSLKHNVSK